MLPYFSLFSFVRYLSIECEENNDPHIRERYTLVRRKFLENLLSVSVQFGAVTHSCSPLCKIVAVDRDLAV